MKSIEIDDDLYAFIASQTKHIGENASQILRRLLMSDDSESVKNQVEIPQVVSETELQPAPEASPVEQEVQESLEPQEEKATIAPVESTEVRNSSPVTQANASSVDVSNDILSIVTVDAISGYTKRVDQFLFILGEAYRLNQARFEEVEALKGKNRTYFAKSKEALLLNGSSTNPKQIPDSPYWVVSNNNTAKKINMLQNVLLTLGYEQNIVETLVSRFSQF